MKEIKRIILRVIFTIEVIAFAGIYAFGPHGVKKLMALNGENNSLINDIEIIKNEISEIEHTIVQWNTHSFYKEKIAREQLQMAHKSDEIYYY